MTHFRDTEVIVVEPLTPFAVAETTRYCVDCGRVLHHLRTTKQRRNINREKHFANLWACNNCGNIASTHRSVCPPDCDWWLSRTNREAHSYCRKHYT